METILVLSLTMVHLQKIPFQFLHGEAITSLITQYTY